MKPPTPFHRRQRHSAVKRRANATFLVVLVSTVLFVGAPSEVAAQWKQDWKVQCTWMDQLMLEKLLAELATYVTEVPEAGEIVEWLAVHNCDDSEKGIAWFVRRELRASSYWLNGLGFEPPIMNVYPDDDRKYLAWLSVLKFLKVEDDGSVGIEPNGYYYDNGDLYIHPSMIFAGRPVEAHELYHGVQNGTAPLPFQTKGDHFWWDQWIWEGSARAEDQVWSAKTGRQQGIEYRHWDNPIYYFDKEKNSKYATARFWADVGRQLRGRDYIDVMTEVFEEISSQGPPASNSWESIKSVDEALTRLLQDRGQLEPDFHGLQQMFPEFVRFRLWDVEIVDWQFDDPQLVDLTLPNPDNGEPTHFVSKQHDLHSLAVDAYEVEVEVPPGRMGGLRIELAPDQTVKNVPGPLHLIVDRRRYNRALPDGRRNIFSTTISGSDQMTPYFVRVANAAGPVNLNQETYTLNFNLTSSHAEATVGGAESVLVNDGVLFSYININRDPNEIARSMQTGLIDRFADHAGVSEETEAGKISREQIAGVAALELGTPPPPLGEGGGRKSITDGASCLATITIYDDETRSVVKMLWRGSEPFIGGIHDIKGSFSTDIHDSIYPTLKSMGQELTMLEDPEALSRYMEEIQGLAVPGLADAARQAGDEAAAAQVEGVLGGLFNSLPFTPSREGKLPAQKKGQDDFGRSYSEGGQGSLEIEPGPADRIVGHYQFTAVDPKQDQAVNVTGDFVAVPGPLSTDNLWNGCEDLLIYPEDNGMPGIEPPVYPPGLDDEDECEDEDETSWRECFCEKYPLTPIICIPIFPWPEGTPTPTPTGPTPTVTRTPTGPAPTPTRTPTGPTPTPTPTPTGPTPTPTPRSTGTPIATPTPKGDEPGSGTPGEPGKPGDSPGGPGDPGDTPPSEGESNELKRNLILDFLEEKPGNLRSAPQPVNGSASIVQVAVTAKTFNLSLVLSDAEMAPCGFNASVRMGIRMMASGKAIKGTLRLDAAAGEIDLNLHFKQGDISVHGDTGSVTLSQVDLTTIRGDVSGGDLELDLDQGQFSCEGLMDFAFTVTGGP
jgi:hypothetical protein